MVRNIQVEAVDTISRPLIAVGNDYPDGHIIPPHQHRRGQLISGAAGVLVLSTPQGRWVMPPQHGLWIPPGVVHDVQVVGAVRMQSLYLEPAMTGGMPGSCQVVGISPFMRGLVNEAMELPADYDPDSRAGALMSLILFELQRMPILPLSLPYPAHVPLVALCRAFMKQPRITDTIENWTSTLGMSRRSFTRLFRSETGVSFLTWRQQACIVMALPRLIGGEAVTAVAIDLGYENPAAFTAMFKRVLGASPRTYLKRNG